MRKFLSVLVLFIGILSESSKGVCPVEPTALLNVTWTFLATAYNMFPLKIGGVTVIPSMSKQSYGTPVDVSMEPICTCLDPIPRMGISMSFWEVIALIDTVKDPYCFRSYGLHLPLPIRGEQFGGELYNSGFVENGNILKFFHTHSLPFFPFEALGMFLDSVCFQASDLASYMSELDPICSHDDDWCTLIGNPEAMLLSSALTQIACNFYDSVRVIKGPPADECFWVAGAHSIFPTTGNTKSNSYIGAAATALEKTIYKMHRAGLLFGRVGQKGMCSAFYLPIWKKSIYNKQLVLPIPDENRVPVGYPADLYGSLKNLSVPGLGDNLSWFLYRYRSCCAF